MGKQRNLPPVHLGNIARHLRALEASARTGTLGDEELAKRIAAIAECAEVYARYWQRQGDQPSCSPPWERKIAEKQQ